MKRNSKLAFLTVAALVLAVGFAAPALAGGKHHKTEKAEKTEGGTTSVIPVSGMTCGGCASAIKTAVKKMDGVMSVEVDHEGGKTSVTYDKEKVSVAQIVETINKTGFKATAPKESDS